MGSVAGVVDLAAYRHTAAAARRSLTDGDETTALNLFIDALRRWHGRAGEGMAESSSAEAIFTALDCEYLDVGVETAWLARRQQSPQLVLNLLRQAAAVGPLHEPVHAELVANLALSGRHAEALAAYEAIRSRLEGELGIGPSPALRLAYGKIGGQSELENAIAQVAMRERTARTRAERMAGADPRRSHGLGVADGLAEAVHLITDQRAV